MDVPTKGGQKRFHGKLFTGKRPFLTFSWEKSSLQTSQKNPNSSTAFNFLAAQSRVAQGMPAGTKGPMRKMLFGVPPHTKFRGLLRLSCMQ